MKKTNLLFITLLLLAACSPKDNSNLEHLLATVPADVSSVAVIDIRMTPEVADAMAANRDIADLGKAIRDGQSGLMDAPVVWFTEGDTFYFTGLLSDPALFRQFASEQEGEDFSEIQGVDICGYYAVKGNQFWFSRSTLGAKEINRFTGLGDKRSCLGSDAAPLLLDDDSDVRGLFDVNELLRRSVAGGDRAAAQLAVATLFREAEYASLEIDFDDGKAEAEVKILDSKLKPTKFLLPADKISEKTLLSLPETADAVIAVNIGKKLVGTILEKGAALIPAEVGAALQPVDGTFAVAEGEDVTSEIMIITTDGGNTSALASMLAKNGSNVSTEGNQLRIARGNVAGQLLVKDAADTLGDAFAGIVATPHGLMVGDEPGVDASAIRSVTILLKPYEGSLKLTGEIKFEDKKESGLVQLLKVLR